LIIYYEPSFLVNYFLIFASWTKIHFDPFNWYFNDIRDYMGIQIIFGLFSQLNWKETTFVTSWTNNVSYQHFSNFILFLQRGIGLGSEEPLWSWSYASWIYNYICNPRSVWLVLVLLCLTSHSTIFHLYRGGQFYWWRKPRVPGENHRPAASHWYILPHNAVSIAPRVSGIRAHNFSGDWPRLHR
jgi:hypothetical protein